MAVHLVAAGACCQHYCPPPPPQKKRQKKTPQLVCTFTSLLGGPRGNKWCSTLSFFPCSYVWRRNTVMISTQANHIFTVLPALSALRQTHACADSNASTAKPIAFALSHTSALTFGTISPQTSGTLLLSLPSKANSVQFLFSEYFS